MLSQTKESHPNELHDHHRRSNRKFVLLCLPGWRTSAAVFEKQLEISGLRPILDQYAELIFLDPLHPALGEPDPTILRLDVPGPYHQWWRLREARGGPNGGMEDVVYEGVTESLEYVRNKVGETLIQNGRFDGFLGFSQGSVCSLLVTMAHLTGSIQLPVLPKFLILISGFVPRDVMSKPWAQQLGPLNIPSLHITGSKDAIHDRSLATAQRFFINPKLVIHSQTHVVPRLNREPPQIEESIREFLADMNLMVFHTTDNDGHESGNPTSATMNQYPPLHPKL